MRSLMRMLAALIVLAAALELGACGGDQPLDIRDPDRKEKAPDAEKAGATTSTPAEAEGKVPRAGEQSKSAKRRLIYLDARTLCDRFGVKRIVRTFGVEGGSAADVARRYAEQNYSAPFRNAGYRGCLAGLKK